MGWFRLEEAAGQRISSMKGSNVGICERERERKCRRKERHVSSGHSLINFSCLQVILVKQLHLKSIFNGTMLSLQLMLLSVGF